MLSQKLQDDLMNAYQQVHEAKRGHAAGASDVEKQASQLASDVRYKAKGKFKEGTSEEEKKKVFMSILGASPAPAAVKSMAKQKLLGEEVVEEGIGDVVKRIMKGSAQKQRYGMTGDDMSAVKKTSGDFSAMRAKRKEQIGGSKIHNQRQLDKFVDKSEKDKVPVVTKTSGQFGSDTAIKRKYNPKKGVELTDKFGKDTYPSKQYEEVEVKEGSSYGMYKGDGMSFPERLKKKAKEKKKKMTEDAKMGRMSDDDLGKAHEKFSGMDQSTPSNKFMLKRIEKEQKKRKKMTEAKVDMKIPDYKRATARDKRYGNPHGSLELGGGIRKDRRADHEARRGVKKEEVVNEMGGMKVKQVVKTKPPKNEKDMSKEPGQKAPVDYRMLAQSHKPVGNIFNEKKMDPVGQEDGDINNDGKKDGTDKYLMNRRKAIGKAIAKKRGKVKEGFSAWRIDLDFNEQVKK